MFATLFFATLFSFLTLRAVHATEFTVVTPEFKQCASAHISWSPTKGPYTVAIVNASSPCGDAVLDLGEHTGTSLTLNVTIPCGSNVEIWVGDANDDEAWSGNIKVESSDDQSCLPPAALLSNNNNAASESSSSSSSAYNAPAAATTSPSTASSTTAGNSANAKSSSGPIGGLKNGGAPSVREIPAPVLLLGTIALAFTLTL